MGEKCKSGVSEKGVRERSKRKKQEVGAGGRSNKVERTSGPKERSKI